MINRRNGAALVSRVLQRPTLSSVMLSDVPPASWSAEMQGKKTLVLII